MTSVVLKFDEYSKQLLREELKPYIPNWNVFADSIIIHQGRAKRSDIVGISAEVKVIEFGYTEDAMVVKLEEFKYSEPYIIIASKSKEPIENVNPSQVKNWFKIKIPFVLRGKIVEKINTNGTKIIESLIDLPKDKSQIIRVAFYDFDKTLVNTVNADVGRFMWEKKTKKKYPHVGWWSKKESLDRDVFDFKPITEITERLKRDFNDKSCWTVLLTNRIVNLKEEVMGILSSLGLQVDEVKMVEKDHLNKNSRITVVLESLPQASVIEVFDDDMGNIEMFLELKKKLTQDGKSVSIFHVNPENYDPRVIEMS
jgi:hypothetical protein